MTSPITDASREARIKDSIYFGADWCQWHPEYYAGFTGPIHAMDTSHGLSVVMDGDRVKAGDLKGADMAGYLQDCANAVPALIAECEALRQNLERAMGLYVEAAGERDAQRGQLAAAWSEGVEKAARYIEETAFVPPDARAQAVSAIRALKSNTPEGHEMTTLTAARALLANRWGGYGNPKAAQAMCDFIYRERGRMPFPASFYDGVMQAGLRAIAQERVER